MKDKVNNDHSIHTCAEEFIWSAIVGLRAIDDLLGRIEDPVCTRIIDRLDLREIDNKIHSVLDYLAEGGLAEL